MAPLGPLFRLLILVALAALAVAPATAQTGQSAAAPSEDPRARIFDPMIGVHQCRHERTDYETRETRVLDATWTWTEEMNGNAIRDWGDHGGPNVTLRIFDAVEGIWHMWYFMGGANYYAGEWTGGAEDGRIVFRNETHYGERPVLSLLEYTNVTDDGFEWQSTDIYRDTGEEFVDWRISCRKVH